MRSSPLTNSEVRARNSKYVGRTPGARKRSRSRSLSLRYERHGYTCRGCGAITLRQCYNVPSVLACSRDNCSVAFIITAVYNVSSAKHARQEGFGKVYQVPSTEGRPDHSAVEVGPKSQHYMQAGLVSLRLGKSKVCFNPYNLSGFTFLILVLIYLVLICSYFQDVCMLCVYIHGWNRYVVCVCLHLL